LPIGQIFYKKHEYFTQILAASGIFM